MSGEVDQLTLERARRGELAACARIVEQHQAAVFALCARLAAGQPAIVEDVAQEAFMRVLKGLPRFDPAGPARLSTWILTIATRVCLNALRDGRRREAVARRLPPPQSPPPEDPERTAAERQRGRQIEAAMADLPEEMRAVLVLRAYHDFEYEEIARALGIELGTVKSRLGRAREALRGAIAAPASDEPVAANGGRR